MYGAAKRRRRKQKDFLCRVLFRPLSFSELKGILRKIRKAVLTNCFANCGKNANIAILLFAGNWRKKDKKENADDRLRFFGKRIDGRGAAF